MKNVVIAGYARSPFTFAQKGALINVRPDELAAEVVKGLVARTGVNADDIARSHIGLSNSGLSRLEAGRIYRHRGVASGDLRQSVG